MPTMQIALSQRAHDYLRQKIRRSRGYGVYLSELVVAEAVKEEMQQILDAHKGALLDAWNTETGLDSVE